MKKKKLKETNASAQVQVQHTRKQSRRNQKDYWGKELSMCTLC